MNHKKNVGIEAWKDGLYIHAFTHDLSKFLPSEFIPYSKFFHDYNRYDNYRKEDEKDSNFQIG